MKERLLEILKRERSDPVGLWKLLLEKKDLWRLSNRGFLVVYVRMGEGIDSRDVERMMEAIEEIENVWNIVWIGELTQICRKTPCTWSCFS